MRDRNVDSGEGLCTLRQHEQRVEQRERPQVIALRRLGWPVRRIEQETGVRRETTSAYLKATGIGVRPPRAWRRRGDHRVWRRLSCVAVKNHPLRLRQNLLEVMTWLHSRRLEPKIGSIMMY